MSQTERSVLIVGNGPQAREYAKVFREGLKYRFSVSGLVSSEIEEFRTSEGAERSILLDHLSTQTVKEFDFVVAVTSPNSLAVVTTRLINLSASAILVEKPVALSVAALEEIRVLTQENGTFCRVAYNRRYYKSVRALKAILATEPALQAVFDFTELATRIKIPGRAQETMERWALVNSCHVFDTVRFLLGDFKPSYVFHGGEGALDWHPSSADFAGVGTCGEAVVSYTTSWQCPGRWSVEISTKNGRYKLSPMERLQVMRHDSFEWREIDAGYDIDIRFKPGLHDMVAAFDAARLARDDGARQCTLPTLEENNVLAATISRLVGY